MTFCDDDCCQEPLAHKLLVTLTEAVAPIIAAYLLSKLDESYEDEREESEE